MRLYRSMQRLRWPTSYLGRILLICFVGTHVPLLVLLAWTMAASGADVPLSVLVVVLVGTLVGTAATLIALRSMLKPVLRSAQALDAYAADRTTPSLPSQFADEAGRLMASVQTTLRELDERMDEVTRLAMADDLTGARNRRWLNDFGIPMMDANQRRGTPWSLLVIDLDEFKSINDNWGHSIGDQVLIAVVDAIGEAVRDCDHIVRTGGDEFSVLLPGADHAVLLEIADRVRLSATDAARNLPIDHAVTISIGGTTARRKDGSFVEIYRRADRNLYDVKASGRNAVIAR